MARRVNVLEENNKLNIREEKYCRFFCYEGNHTYLDRLASFKAAGYSTNSDPVGVARNAFALHNKPHIQKRIKELLPQVAFDQLFVRQELKDLYDEIKSDTSKTKERKDVLVEMGKILGMYEKKNASDDSSKDSEDTEKHAAEATRLWQEQVKKFKTISEFKSGT